MNYKQTVFLLLIIIPHSLITKVKIGPGYYMEDEDFWEYYDAVEAREDTRVKFNKETEKVEVVEQNQENNNTLACNESNVLVKDLVIENEGTAFDMQQFAKDAKIPLLIGGSVLSIYGYFILKLSNAQYYINKSINWSCFKKNVPLETLYELPEDKILNELTHTIYRTFSNDENNPNYDDIEPLYLFIKAAKKEVKKLESFINLYWYLKLPIISLIFPNLDDELLLAQEKIDRLSYMQELISDKIYTLSS